MRGGAPIVSAVAERADETHDVSPAPGAGAAPPALDYFAANAPARRESRGAFVCAAALALGCVPYLCGVMNALVVAQSHSAAITTSHLGGAAIFMGLGIALSAAALVGFVRLRHVTGIVASLLLLGMQAAVAACLGLG